MISKKPDKTNQGCNMTSIKMQKVAKGLRGPSGSKHAKLVSDVRSSNTQRMELPAMMPVPAAFCICILRVYFLTVQHGMLCTTVEVCLWACISAFMRTSRTLP